MNENFLFIYFRLFSKWKNTFETSIIFEFELDNSCSKIENNTSLKFSQKPTYM